MTKAEFLSKLADEARGSLSPELTQALVCEVAGHLDESIQSRLELGEPPEVAEINAIAAFAKPQEFVRKMEAVHDGVRQHDRVLLGLGAVIVLCLSFATEIAMSGLLANSVFLCILLGILVAFAARSAMLLTPRWGTLKVLAVIAVVLVAGWQPLRTLNLWEYGGMGYLPVSSLQPYLAAEVSQRDHPVRELWIDPSEAQANLDAAQQAATAPLIERWSKSMKPSGQLLGAILLVLFVAHLTPIAFRRRLRRSRGRTALRG